MCEHGHDPHYKDAINKAWEAIHKDRKLIRVERDRYLKALEGVQKEARRLKEIKGGLETDREVVHAVADNFESIATEAIKESE